MVMGKWAMGKKDEIPWSVPECLIGVKRIAPSYIVLGEPRILFNGRTQAQLQNMASCTAPEREFQV